MGTNDQGITVQRQYIGARYVPKFFQGPDGTPAWVANVPYEPLTIVTYLGNSYTSKIPVPTGIGNPSENPTYWALTGAYNAQVGQYQQQVQEYKQQVQEYKQLADQTASALTTETTNRENADTALQANIQQNSNSILSIRKQANNRKFILIADSYGMRESSKPTWTELFVNDYPETINSSVSSIGFTTSPSFQNNLESATADLTQEQKNEITDIVVCGGWNDARQITLGLKTSNDIINAITAFTNYCNSNFPNAKVWVGFIGWQTCKVVQTGTNVNDLYITSIAYNTGIKNVYNLTSAQYVMKYALCFDETYFHPSPYGSIMLYRAIKGDLFGSGFIMNINGQILPNQVTMNIGTMVSFDYYATQSLVTLNAIFTGISSGATSVTICTFPDNLLPTGNSKPIRIMGQTFGGDTERCVYLALQDNKLLINSTNVPESNILINYSFNNFLM